MRSTPPAAASPRAARYQALADFRYELRRFLRFSEQAASAVGLTPKQHQALLAVHGFPGRARCSIGELAERLAIRHHSAVGLVNRLVARGLMRREPGTDDRRLVFVRLTPRGERLLGRLAEAHQAELRRVGPQLRLLLRRLAADGAPHRNGHDLR